MSTYQLEKWKGEFGNDYANRNIITEESLYAREALFTNIYLHMNGVLPETILEIGAGTGINIKALEALYKKIKLAPKLYALEPNELAKNMLKNLPVGLIEGDACNIQTEATFNMVFTSGVLIHIPPESLLNAMDEIYKCSNKYVLSIEYFSPKQEEIKYRELNGLLWRNDFGSVWLENFPLRCVAYGFCWKKVTKLDNLTWWLMEKTH